MKIRMKIAIFASLLALIIVLAGAIAIAFNPLGGRPALSEPELKAIARAWAADNMDGAAGDELVEFIVANTTVNAPDLLREYLNVYMDSGATWTYGPFANAGRGSYEVSATVALRMEDIMPIEISDEVKASGAPTPTPLQDPGDFRNVFTMTFRLTMDAASKSVTGWRVHDGQAIYAPVTVTPTS